MTNGGMFNIDNQVKPANKDIIVVFSPSNNTVKYNYTIYQNGKAINTINVDSNKPSNIVLDDSGNYQISAISYDVLGQKSTVNSGIYIIDKEPPVLNVKKSHVTINKGQEFDINEGVSASDNHDGDLTSSIVTNKINLDEVGRHKITYTVSDEAGNTAVKDVMVDVNGINNNLFMVRRNKMQLNKREFARYQEYWKNSKLLAEREKEELISISNLFLKRVEENGDEVEEVELLFPEDTSNLNALRRFAETTSAMVTVRTEGGVKVHGWFLNDKIQVE